jgi:hypothetical protein
MRREDLARLGSASDVDVDVDCPWFDTSWLLDHPDFPLDQRVVVGNE